MLTKRTSPPSSIATMSIHQMTPFSIERKTWVLNSTRQRTIAIQDTAQATVLHPSWTTIQAAPPARGDDNNSVLARRYIFAGSTTSRTTERETFSGSSSGTPTLYRRYTSSYYEASRKRITERQNVESCGAPANTGMMRSLTKESYRRRHSERIVVTRA